MPGIGIGIGPPRGGRNGAGGGGGVPVPPIFATADLTLDSRVGVEETAGDITAWRNTGTGGAGLDFLGVTPFLQYNPADIDLNDQPSAEQLGALGRVENANFAELNYLHEAASWTLVVAVDLTNNSTAQFILGNVTFGIGSGLFFQVSNVNDLIFGVYDAAGNAVASASAPYPGGGKLSVVGIRFNGTTYTVYVDGVSIGGSPVNLPHSVTPRVTPYAFGNKQDGLGPLAGKLGHLSTWTSDIGEVEVQAATAHLLEVFAGIVP